ncbi:MAG: hypothetical protein D6731_22280 [Planctomycetota bacterium]|nr:MAG: hypothetical protein D6731_22280 [Planctomycetota bacterium]
MKPRNTGRPALLARHWLGLSALAAFVFSGCGAAYYGTAIGIIATQKEDDTDLSFPDAEPHAPVVPPLAVLDYGASPAQVTVTRQVAGVSTQVTGFEVRAVNFPSARGEARSNRDADINLFDGDRLVVRINGGAAQELGFGPADVASTGSAVAATLQAKLRALDATDPNIAGITVFFEEATRSYVVRTGLPSAQAEILFEPAAQAGDTVFTNQTSSATAARLGLGEANGGISLRGDEPLRVAVVNSGTDVLPGGAALRLYLSHDKSLDPAVDLCFDVLTLDASVSVGEARVFARRNGRSPPAPLIQSDITAGKYYVLFDLAVSPGEADPTDNLLAAGPVEVVQPVDDPQTPAVEVADALDFAPTSLVTPISLLVGNALSASVGVTNYGAAVGTGGQTVDIDLSFSADQTYEAPAAFQDPAGTQPGVRINPLDPNRAITVSLTAGGAGTPLSATATGDTIDVAYDPMGSDSVNDFISALNAAGSLVDAFHDGVGDPSAPGSFQALVTAIVGASLPTTAVAKDLFLATKRVTFPASAQQTTRFFSLSGPVRAGGILASRLPTKLIPFVRIRPTIAPPPVDPQNTRNDVREGKNYVRLYDPALATFDSDTGTLLPTVNADDFARLQFVSQSGINTSQIRQGQQRVFSFEIPAKGLSVDASQLLVLVRSDDFDPHVDLLSANGDYIAGSDDSDAGTAALIYVPVQAASGNRIFYVVVSTARLDEADLTSSDESFELTISVNAQESTDPALVKAVALGGLPRGVPARYANGAPRIHSHALVPLDMSAAKAEVFFVLPAAARVRFRSQPVFTIGVDAKLTGFIRGNATATDFPEQQVLDPSARGILYRPSGGGALDYFDLPAGVYTFSVEGVDQPPVGDPQTNLRLEIDAEFKPGG